MCVFPSLPSGGQFTVSWEPLSVPFSPSSPYHSSTFSSMHPDLYLTHLLLSSVSCILLHDCVSSFFSLSLFLLILYLPSTSPPPSSYLSSSTSPLPPLLLSHPSHSPLPLFSLTSPELLISHLFCPPLSPPLQLSWHFASGYCNSMAGSSGSREQPLSSSAQS